MDPEEHQAMLNKISQVAGQINRHKNGQLLEKQERLPQSHGVFPHSSTEWRGANRGNRGFRGARGLVRRGRHNHVHRNRTLVLNANNTVASAASENVNPSINAATSTWVSKIDPGHRQLINPAVFEKEKGPRLKSMEELRLQKLKKKDQHERAKLERHLKADKTRQVIVDGGIFRVSKRGQKLERISGETLFARKRVQELRSVKLDLHDIGAPTPKVGHVAGVKFYRSKNGNMYRDASIKIYGKAKKTTKPCRAFTITGSCATADCPFVHDPSKVAVCREFVQKRSCPSGDSCDLSHELIPERTPTCMHFAKGHCLKDNCPYTHVRVSPSALVCRSFGIYGYCEKGASCTDRHVHECPDFSNTGTCTTEGCKLLHRHKASIMRGKTDPTKHAPDYTMQDISSDEEGMGSDDVDSDGLEEFFGDEEGGIDQDIPQQQDFVSIR